MRQVDALFSGLIDDREPGAAVLVANDAGVVFEQGFGITDLQTGHRIEARTNFRLASFTKQFTAAAVMLLVRDGNLRYEDSLTDIFPEFPEYGRAITARHLLNHTPGLPDYEDLTPPADHSLPPSWVQIRDAGVFELLKKEKSGKFRPGSRWTYSNSGYMLPELLVQRVPRGRHSETVLWTTL